MEEIKVTAGKNDYAAYVFYLNRPDLLVRSIRAFPQLISELVVVNNSGKELHEVLSADEAVECCFKARDVFEPPVPLTYSQSMNWMLKDALSKEVDFIIHFHSDAFSTNPSAVEQLLTKARELRDTGRRWACLYTLHDLLWAVNPVALADIGGADTTFPTYFTDDCLRMRWRRRGWERVLSGIEGIGHEGSATINSDPVLQFVNSRTFPYYAKLYAEMYGGGTGEETLDVPWGREDLFDDPNLSWRP